MPPIPSGLDASMTIRLRPGRSSGARSTARSGSPGRPEPDATRRPLTNSVNSGSTKNRASTRVGNAVDRDVALGPEAQGRGFLSRARVPDPRRAARPSVAPVFGPPVDGDGGGRDDHRRADREQSGERAMRSRQSAVRPRFLTQSGAEDTIAADDCMTVIAVIPARYASVRFPGKPLAPLAGKPMVLHVLEAVRAARRVDRVLVATDDVRIAECVRAAGGEAVLTVGGRGERHRPRRRGRPPFSGRRLRERAGRRAPHAGRERGPRGRDARLAGRAGRWPPSPRRSEPTPRRDPNTVKVAVAADGRALYFSRSPIPYFRQGVPAYRKHLGIYAYRAETLADVAALPPVAARARGVARAAAVARGGSYDLGGGGGRGFDRRRHAGGPRPGREAIEGCRAELVKEAVHEHEVRFHHRRRRLVARQGNRGLLDRGAARGARLLGRAGEVRPVHQRRSRARCRPSSTARSTSPTTAPRPTSTSATTSGSRR